MATNGWGQGAVNNTIGYGKGKTTATNNWGKIYDSSASGDTSLGTAAAGFADTTSWALDGVDEFLNNSNTFNTFAADDGNSSIKWTINLWVKLDSLPASGSELIYRIAETDGTSVNYLLVTSTGKLQAGIAGSGSNWTRSGDGVIVVGNWYMISVRYDSTQSSRYHRLKIRVNGATPTGHGSNFLIANSNASANINLASTYGGTSNINGHINEFSIFYGQAFTNDELATLYNSGAATDLNENTPTPTNWFRSENATWDGSNYTMTDEMGTGIAIVSNNMEQEDRDSDVPT